MRLLLVAIAEQAQIRPDGKLDIVGIFNAFNTSTFPARIRATLVFRVDFDPEDYELLSPFLIRVLDADDQELARGVSQPVQFDAPRSPGLPITYDVIVPIDQTIPHAGVWTFAVGVADRTIARVPAYVGPPPSPGTRP